MSKELISSFRRDTRAAIDALKSEFEQLIRDAKIEVDEPLASSRQKLQLDVHTMTIDQNARKLLQIIRCIKEIKVSDNTYDADQEKFENQCEEAASRVRECIVESYQELTRLSDEGFAVRQAASKHLR
jgi:hypothetical protein